MYKPEPKRALKSKTFVMSRFGNILKKTKLISKTYETFVFDSYRKTKDGFITFTERAV